MAEGGADQEARRRRQPRRSWAVVLNSEGEWRLVSEMRLSDGGKSRLDNGFESKWEP